MEKIQASKIHGSGNRVLVKTSFEASKALYLKAFQSLKNCLD